ncbi:MAG: C1 family peptidase [Candidatus Sericytochromatia bacterium]
MSLKKSLLSTLLASLTLVSVAACNGGQSQLEQLPSENVSAPVEEGVGIASTGATYKLNFDYKKVEKNSITYSKKNSLSTKKADLRNIASPVGDQGKLGSCTAFSMVKGVREAWLNKQGQTATQLSPLYFYYKERELDGSIDQDRGSTITTGMQVLQETGTTTEALWPYDIAKFAVAPSAAADAAAGQYKMKSATKIKTFDEFKAALDAGYPIAFGFRVYESFMKSKGGVIPMPNTQTEKLLGGHAVAAFGYDDAKEVVIVRNSWSAKWGDGGYCYMPYGYFSSGLVRDVWVAKN